MVVYQGRALLMLFSGNAIIKLIGQCVRHWFLPSPLLRGLLLLAAPYTARSIVVEDLQADRVKIYHSICLLNVGR